MKILNINNTPELTYSTYKERKVARVVTIKDEKVLLIHSQKYNTYTLPGGGVEEGESLEQAAIREVLEETGLVVSIVKEIEVTTEVFDKRGILNVTTAFLGQIENENAQALDPESIEEGQKLVWISLHEVMNLIETVKANMQDSAMTRDSFFIQEHLNTL